MEKMKAKSTRHLIHEALNQILNVGNHLNSKQIIWNHEVASHEELDELKRLAEIGKALECVIEYGIKEYYGNESVITQGGEFDCIDDLIEWFENRTTTKENEEK